MSGSMWAQVEGVAKVNIARDAFGGMVNDWAKSDTRAGLIAYGHRRKGYCSDIELLADRGTTIDIVSLSFEPVGRRLNKARNANLIEKLTGDRK